MIPILQRLAQGNAFPSANFLIQRRFQLRKLVSEQFRQVSDIVFWRFIAELEPYSGGKMVLNPHGYIHHSTPSTESILAGLAVRLVPRRTTRILAEVAEKLPFTAFRASLMPICQLFLDFRDFLPHIHGFYAILCGYLDLILIMNDRSAVRPPEVTMRHTIVTIDPSSEESETLSHV